LNPALDRAVHDADLAEFAACFHEYCEIVDDAARYGPSPAMEDLFGMKRAWLLGHYSAIRLRLRPMMGGFGPGYRDRTMRPDADAIDDLLASATLTSAVNQAEGRLRHAFASVRAILEQCRVSQTVRTSA